MGRQLNAEGILGVYRTSDYGGFAPALLQAIADGGGVVWIADQEPVHASVTTPANVTLRFSGGQLSPDAGVTLTIGGPIEAGASQIFGGAGTVLFGAGADGRAFADWWGLSYNAAVDDSNAINATIVAVANAGGGTVRLGRAADCYISAGVKMYNFCTLEIPPCTALRMMNYQPTTDMITNIDHVGNGNVGVTITGGGEIDGRQWCQNCISNYGGNAPTYLKSLTVTNMRIHDAVQDGIFSTQTTTSLVDGSLRASGNVIYNCSGRGVNMMNSDGNQVDGNTIYSCTDAGIYAGVTADGTIHGNNVSSCGSPTVAGSGVELNATSWVKVHNNLIHSCYGHGVYAHGGGNNNSVIGNTVWDVSYTNAGLYDNVHWQDETYGQVATNTLQAGNNAANWGINEVNTANFNSISGNTFDPTYNGVTNNWVGGRIHMAGGARLNSVAAHNPGFNPVGELGAPAIPASGTAITNPFEVDCTVYVNGGTLSQVAIGGSATGSLGGVYRVSAGQSITLTYSVVPTSWVWFGD